MKGMLSSSLVQLFQTNQFKINSIIKMEDFIVNQVQGRFVVVLLRLSVLSLDEGRIGDPANIEAVPQQV